MTQRRGNGPGHGGPASGRPALGIEGLRPWEPGNMFALRHGARSARTLEPLADQFEAELIAAAPWLDRPAYRGALKSLAWAEAELLLRRAWHNEHGLLTEDGESVAGIERLDRAESRAAKLRDSLGLTPMSSAKMLKAIADSLGPDEKDEILDALRAEGRVIIAQRQQLAAVDEDDGPDAA